MRLLSDSELFVEQATWFAPLLPQPTIGAFACWLAPWLRGCSKRALEALYRLNHPTQRNAESALIELLEAAPKRAAHQFVRRDQCGRGTDWPSTLALSHPFSPSTFIHQRPTPDLDIGVLSGLATIARQWAYLLTEYGGYAETHLRVTQLKNAARPFGPGGLTLAHIRRLARLPQLAGSVAALRSALELMSLPLTSPDARTSLARICGELVDLGRAELENQDDALEVSVILCIARAAQGLGWTVSAAQASQGRPKPTLKLARGKMRCAINKGRFEYPAEPKRRVVDALAMLERESLGLASTGRQPDVVINFWNVEAPEHVLFCIADAKRNESGDGVAYLKKSITAMTAYMVAFAEPLRVRLAPGAGGFVAPLMPAATLFLRQGAAGHVGSHSLQAREGRSNASRAWLTALGSRHYAAFGNDSWCAQSTLEWFGGIVDQAQRLLTGPGCRSEIAVSAAR